MALYLIHFDEPFSHAKHYLGYCDERDGTVEEVVERRADRHFRGRGSTLLRHVTAAGILWRVVRVWERGTRSDERRLKKHSSTRLCPVCEGDSAYGRAKFLQPV